MIWSNSYRIIVAILKCITPFTQSSGTLPSFFIGFYKISYQSYSCITGGLQHLSIYSRGASNFILHFIYYFLHFPTFFQQWYTLDWSYCVQAVSVAINLSLISNHNLSRNSSFQYHPPHVPMFILNTLLTHSPYCNLKSTKLF